MTDTNAWTSGPWEAVVGGCGDWEVIKPDPRDPSDPWAVATVYDEADGGTAEANARLIAAAPELVAALRLARRFIPDAYEADLAIVDAALTKAGVFS